MKTILSFFFLCLLESSLYASPLQITLADTINPGTADYIISAIERAKDEKASYLILQLDTPGGLLNSTRHIIQKILASPVPVVVFIGPKGAQAGSAGALITLAADVAAMAPGTNIGAAHPVSSSDEMNKTMSEKITNDTAAFAESLAQAKKRNTEWARRIVTTSVSVTAEEALKIGAIEMMADDVPHLIQKLKGYKLSTPKEVSILPLQEESPHFHPLSVKQRVVSFFADPNLAYLVMSFGALCLWIELTHPGLIFPGVLAVLSILLSLVSFQFLPINYGALALIVAGFLLFIAELFVPAFGSLGIGGILCFVLGSLYLMDTDVPQFQLSPTLIMVTTALLALGLALLSYLILKRNEDERGRH